MYDSVRKLAAPTKGIIDIEKIYMQWKRPKNSRPEGANG